MFAHTRSLVSLGRNLEQHFSHSFDVTNQVNLLRSKEVWERQVHAFNDRKVEFTRGDLKSRQIRRM
jgi:hypothetical protein